MTDQPRGVQTNGIGQKTTAHLNLTRSLADVDWIDGSRQQREAGKPKAMQRTAKRADTAELTREIDRWIARNC